MEIIRLHETSQKEAVKRAVRVLQQGGVVALPTETTYGLACDPQNARAIQKIFRIKGRDNGKPMQLIAASKAQVQNIAMLNAAVKKAISHHWPGPLTLLVPLKRGVKLAAKVSPKQTVGIRVSSLAFVRALARAFGHPIAATSANRSGSIPAFSGKGVVRAFARFPTKPDLLLDAGTIPRNIPSTVARIHDNDEVEILRQGSVSLF